MDGTLKIIKSLADGNRLRVVVALMEHEELCVCQMTEMLGLAMATVSRHMSVLQNAGLVRSRKNSRWVYYRLSPTFPPVLRQWISESLSHSPEMEADRLALGRIVAMNPGALCSGEDKG